MIPRRKTIFVPLGVSLALAAAILNGCVSREEPCPHLVAPDIRSTSGSLRRHVVALADGIGERNIYRPGSMERAADYIEGEFRAMGYTVRRQAVEIPALPVYAIERPVRVFNLEVVKSGVDPAAKTLVIGAHYDTRVGMAKWNIHGPAEPSRVGTPGANDNASGVAALLEMARVLRDTPTANTIRFVAYANEEPPFFQTDAMGSLVHARALVREVPRENILGMISLETLGVYSPRVNRKRASALIPSAVGLPDRCDYAAFLTTNTGGAFAAECARAFSRNCRMPVRCVEFPYVSKEVSWSDDWSYRQSDIPSFAATDTAYLRCDDYHETSDTSEKLDYGPFAEVTLGLIGVVVELARVVDPTSSS